LGEVIMAAEKQSDYVLGHTPGEQLRLIRQARILSPATERFFRDAGIASGMRVLDLRDGRRDHARRATRRPGSSIVSVDVDQASIATARERAQASGSKARRSIRRTPQRSRGLGNSTS
jgi:hypothetical protein